MNDNAFYFRSEANLVYLLGLKAKTPADLLDGLKKIPLYSVYFHTHRFLQQHHYLSPEPPNDFAYWLSNILNMRELGESVASVDIMNCPDIESIRTEIIGVLERYLTEEEHASCAPEGSEFHFLSCKVFILPTHYVAHDLKEFIDAIRRVSVRSLYYHVYEAKLRLKEDENDFTAWFRSLGEAKLAEELSRMDPYTMTLEGLREKIAQKVSQYAGIE